MLREPVALISNKLPFSQTSALENRKLKIGKSLSQKQELYHHILIIFYYQWD